MTGRNDVRKAETRRRIVQAAHELFVADGYAATSMEQIARQAGVAIRTIYLHYDSKAALLLAYHDAWLDALVRRLGERRPGEPLDEAMSRALDGLVADGFDNDRRVDEVRVLPPYLEFLGAGNPEISGHLLQRWVRAQDELTTAFRAAQPDRDPAVARYEASAVFATWLTTLLDFRERFATGEAGPSSHAVGAAAIRAFVRGLGSATSAVDG